MRDRRSVDDLTIEELEQILAIKKRRARLERLQHFERVGRRPGDSPLPEDAPTPTPPAQPTPDVSHHSFLHGDEPTESDRPRKPILRDKLLLAVEFAAALGLVAILIFAALSIRNLNREASAAQAKEVSDLPTPSPTPLISMVVLPGGHTPPTASGGARPNYDEVPTHLRPLVEQQYAGPVIVPTPGPANALRIRIPAIRVDAPVVQGDGWEQLKKGVAQRLGTANPGEPGNMVLSAHNDIYGEIFRHLDQLREGDEIILHTLSQEYVYRVLYWRIVSPTDVSVMEPTTEPILTLISCYPYLVDSDRIVVIAELVE